MRQNDQSNSGLLLQRFISGLQRFPFQGPPVLGRKPAKKIRKSIFETRASKIRSEKRWFLNLQLKLLIPLLILSFINVSAPKAQGAYFWSEQKKIPNYYPIAQQPPYMIADQSRTIHAFNSQPLDLEDVDAAKALFYRQWTQDGGWTSPIDILFDSGGGSVEVLDVTSNSLGVVYVIYQKDFADIYFTYAYIADAGRSTAWAPSILIAKQSTHVSVGFECIASIAAGDNGTIVVVYSGAESGKGLYSTFSTDYGNNWAQPYPVYLTGDESLVVTDPALSAGESGIIHGVWTTFQDDGFAGPGYYANFDQDAGVWSEPTELDLPGIRTPSVIEFKSDVLVSYYHFSTNGNWWRRSSDGGNTWIPPNQLSPRHVGTNGRVSFAIDSTDTLHAFFGERINDLNHGMWQSTWMDGSWATPEAIVRGPQIVDVSGGYGFDPGAARAVIINGNLILVTWATDGFAGVNGAWYSYKMLNAPALPASPYPNPTAEITAAPTSTPVELLPTQPVNTQVPLLQDNDRKPYALLLNPQTSILSGIGLALILVIGILLLRVVARLQDGP
jgi:hypothetical protein